MSKPYPNQPEPSEAALVPMVAEHHPGTDEVADEAPAAVCVADRLVLTAVIERALSERDLKGGRLADRVGVGGTALAVMLMLFAPGHPVLAPEDYVQRDGSEEQGWVRDLLVAGMTEDTETTRWLAAIIARRAMEGAHLWEDLALPDRPTLTRLMERHFAPLAARNSGMRWKRFFFRQLCEVEGLSHCTSPTCCACPDVDLCFEPGAAEALIARQKSAPV